MTMEWRLLCLYVFLWRMEGWKMDENLHCLSHFDGVEDG